MPNVFFSFILLALASSVSVADEQVILIDGPEVDLTVDDVRRALLSTPEDVRAVMLTDQMRLRDVINSTYMTKVAAYRARQQQLDKSKEVKARIWNHTQNILADAELQRVVKENLGNPEDFEAVAREEYLANQDNYRLPERISVLHILFKIAKDGKNDADVLVKAKQTRDSILSGNISFEEAARKYSEDKRSAEMGGRLGEVSRGTMVKPFEDIAFSLQAGKISDPVKTRFGYHLILVEKKIPASIKPFAEVKDVLIKRVREKMIARIKRDYWLQIESDEPLVIHDGAVEDFVKNPVLE